MAEWQELLIELVRNRPCLWDKSHTAYKDSRTIKANNWSDISNEMKRELKADIWTGIVKL